MWKLKYQNQLKIYKLLPWKEESTFLYNYHLIILHGSKFRALKYIHIHNSWIYGLRFKSSFGLKVRFKHHFENLVGKNELSARKQI